MRVVQPLPSLLQIRLDTVQEAEAAELRNQLKQELELLTAYQCKLKMQASAQHKKDVEELKTRVALRKKALRDKVSPYPFPGNGKVKVKAVSNPPHI